MMKSRRVAVIDVGSNTVKLLVAERDADGRPAAVLQRTLETRISAGLSGNPPRLSAAGMQAGVDAIVSLLADARARGPDATVLVATSAVRDVVNGADFREQVLATTGHPLRILSGDEEATFIGRGVLSDPALAGLTEFQLFDLGGGSLECLTFRDGHATQALSLPLGCVRLTERFVRHPEAPLSHTDRSAIEAWVRQTLLASGCVPARPAVPQAVFAGGTMTTARAILGARAGLPMERSSPRLAVADLARLLDEVAGLALSERLRIPGLTAGRADVFPAALATVLTVAAVGGYPAFQHTFHNLRWGIAAADLDAS
ncbi:MAG: phosphatase [Verrucomicrobia bacterium]|nr:phosphatase [Verrucomicrobiota bacterium]